MQKNVIWHDYKVSKLMRAQQKRQKSCLIWFTGLSGSGKSTLAGMLDFELYKRGYHTYILDGDNVRHGLNRDLGFTDKDRVENIRRIGEASKLFVDAGLIVLSAFISPFANERKMVRDLFEPGEFLEIYVSTPLSVCEQRDPKGLYQKARSGEIKNFTGLDSPYEPPSMPELCINTQNRTAGECAEQLISFLVSSNAL